MPNWIIHLGIAYIVAKIIGIRDIRLILLGSILPDVARLTHIAALFPIKPITYISLLEPLHTPYSLLLMTLVVSLLNENFKKAYGILLLGGFIHLILDTMQINLGYPKLWFYPISYYFFSWKLFWPDGSLGILLNVVSFAALAYALFDRNKKHSKFKIKNIHYIVPLFLIIILTPILTYNTFIEKSDYFQQFIENRDELNIAFGTIVNENPVIISDVGYSYELITDINVKEGDLVSVKGKLENGKLRPELIFKHNRYLHVPFSFLGLIIFLIIWLHPPRKYIKYLNNKFRNKI